MKLIASIYMNKDVLGVMKDFGMEVTDVDES